MRTTLEFPAGSALEFLRRVWRLNHALERLSSRMEKRIGITAQQRLVLRCVGRSPGISAGQLAAVLHVDPGTISAALRRLGEKKLIERRMDAVDGRRVALGLTKRGRGLDRPRAGTAEAAVEGLLAAHPARGIVAALRVLDELARRLDEQAPRRAARPTATSAVSRRRAGSVSTPPRHGQPPVASRRRS